MTRHSHNLTLPLVFMASQLWGAGCGHKPARVEGEGAGPAVVQVVAAKPVRKTLTLTTTQPGQIEAFEQAPLVAKISGYVQEVLVDIGDHVKKDQTLIKLSAPEMIDDLHQNESLVAQAEAEVKQAAAAIDASKAAAETAQSKIAEMEPSIARTDAEFERWKSEHARIQELATKGSVTKKLEEETLSQLRSAEAATREANAKIQSARAASYEAQANVGKSQADHAAAEARLRVAGANLARAKTMLAYLKIKAPFDGTVTHRCVDTGHYVAPGSGTQDSPLLVVARTDIVRIFVDIPELEAAQVNAGDPASVQIQASQGRTVDAKVARTSWSLLESNHSLRAAVDVPNPASDLRPGMYATVTIRLDERSQALTVPATAIVRDGAESFVWTVEGGKVDRRKVETGLRTASEVEILSGLADDQLVVSKPPESFKAGQAVQINAPAK